MVLERKMISSGQEGRDPAGPGRDLLPLNRRRNLNEPSRFEADPKREAVRFSNRALLEQCMCGRGSQSPGV